MARKDWASYQISTDYAQFSGNLSATDTDVQLALETLDALSVSGATHTVTIKTDDYTITSSDETVICNSISAFAITLPVATGSAKSYSVKNINTGIITVSNGTDTIDGESSIALDQYTNLQIVDYATNKWVIL
jgi:hypothetical protein